MVHKPRTSYGIADSRFREGLLLPQSGSRRYAQQVMSCFQPIRTCHRLNAVLAAAMALSLAGIATGSAVTPVRGMGASLLGSVLAPCQAVDSRFSSRALPDAKEQPHTLRPPAADMENLPEVAILSVHRPSAPGRGDLPPPLN